MIFPHMMTSYNGNIFRVSGPLCGEFTGHRWIPRTKASDAELWCFLWSSRSLWRHCNKFWSCDFPELEWKDSHFITVSVLVCISFWVMYVNANGRYFWDMGFCVMGNGIQWCRITRILQAESGSNILITYFDKKKINTTIGYVTVLWRFEARYKVQLKCIFYFFNSCYFANPYISIKC